MIEHISDWWRNYNKLETRIRLHEKLEDGVVVHKVYFCEYRIRFHGGDWRSISPFQAKQYSEASSEEKARELLDNFLKKQGTVYQTRDTIIK